MTWSKDAASIVHCVDHLQARELLGRAVAFKLALAAAEGDALTPLQAARQLVATESNPATADALAEVALDAYVDLDPPKLSREGIGE